MRNWVFRFGIVAFVAVCILFCANDASAQVVEHVVFEALVEFDNLFSSLGNVIGGVCFGAVVLGMSIWGTSYVYRIVKSIGRK